MKLVVLEPLGITEAELAKAVKQELGGKIEVEVCQTRSTDEAELIRRGKDADVLVISNLPLKRKVLEGCPKLKMLSVAFTGIDHIDMEYCREKNILVSNCSGYSNTAVSELVFTLLLGLYRHLLPCDAATRRGGTKEGLLGREVGGKSFGVIGTGAIGRQVAALAKAFGCRVLAYNRTVRQLDGIEHVNLETLLRESDIVSLHVPLNDSTRGLIGAEQLALMKKNAVLINTARGPVVKAHDLASALDKGIIAGAGIDVFDGEPPLPADNPLLHCKNVLLTPHVAFATAEALLNRAYMVMANVRLWLAGTPQNVMK